MKSQNGDRTFFERIASEMPFGLAHDVVPLQVATALVIDVQKRLSEFIRGKQVEESRIEKHRVQQIVNEKVDIPVVISRLDDDLRLVEHDVSHQRPLGLGV